MQKDPSVFRWAIPRFDCSSERRDFSKEMGRQGPYEVPLPVQKSGEPRKKVGDCLAANLKAHIQIYVKGLASQFTAA